MLKFTDYYITFQEVPNEVALVFTISNCPFACEGCHSPWLQKDEGENISEHFTDIVQRYQDEVTCVCLMGEGCGESDRFQVMELFRLARAAGLKTCLYTGAEIGPCQKGEEPIDYLKLGPYVQSRGGLDSRSTNQRMYKWNRDSEQYEDITSWFWRKKV